MVFFSWHKVLRFGIYFKRYLCILYDMSIAQPTPLSVSGTSRSRIPPSVFVLTAYALRF